MAERIRRRTIRGLVDTHDTKEEIEKMDKVDKVEPVATEASVEKVASLGIEDSPLMEPMIERKGGDDFLYKDKPQTEPQVQDTVTPDPQPSNQSATVNTPPPQTGTGPKEFQFDPTPQAPAPGDTSTTPSAGGAETNPIPSEISSESSKLIADVALQAFGMFVPDVAHRYSKIPEGHIRKLEQDGKIQSGLMEVVKATNNNNKNAVKLTSEQKQLIREPLIKVLEIKGVKASPETMLAIAIIAVCVMLFMQAHGIKKENDSMVEAWMADHSKSKKLETENDKLKRELAELRERQSQRQDDDIEDGVIEEKPYATVETIN